MNKIILYPLMMMFLLSMVLGISVPHPINGHITADGNAVGNAYLIIQNLNTGIISETTTNSNGFYQVDLGNIDPTFRYGDIIKVSIGYCKDIPTCTKSVAISGGGNEISWDIITEELPIPPIEIIIYKYICWDGSKSDTEDNCPVIPEPEVKIRCADGSIVSNESECPESNENWIARIIGILTILFASAGGWKFYNGKFKHYHRGNRSYHDPNTRHNNPKYRHTRWSDGILRCLKEVSDIQKGIDLSQ